MLVHNLASSLAREPNSFRKSEIRFVVQYLPHLAPNNGHKRKSDHVLNFPFTQAVNIFVVDTRFQVLRFVVQYLPHMAPNNGHKRKGDHDVLIFPFTQAAIFFLLLCIICTDTGFQVLSLIQKTN